MDKKFSILWFQQGINSNSKLNVTWKNMIYFGLWAYLLIKREHVGFTINNNSWDIGNAKEYLMVQSLVTTTYIICIYVLASEQNLTSIEKSTKNLIDAQIRDLLPLDYLVWENRRPLIFHTHLIMTFYPTQLVSRWSVWKKYKHTTCLALSPLLRVCVRDDYAYNKFKCTIYRKANGLLHFQFVCTLRTEWQSCNINGHRICVCYSNNKPVMLLTIIIEDA